MNRPWVDLRLYRLAWLPALFALVVVMFSLEGAPEPVEPAAATSGFAGAAAYAEARRIAVEIPDRAPGSDGDAALAEIVAQRFDEVPAGVVSEQRFDAEYDDEDVELRNVLLTLPGDAESSVVIAAARDSTRGPGAATSAASTGVLIELARALGVAGHDKTFVLASTSGADAGAAGTRELVAALPERESIDAVIVISQPGAAEPRAPFVITSATGAQSGPLQLGRTAELAVQTQTELALDEASAFTQLARLGLPSGLGDQAPLIAGGIPAVRLSAAGERRLPEAADTVEQLARETIQEFGRAAQGTVAAVDVAGELDPGPDVYLELGDNLVAGWALALVALALLIPPAAVATVACLRAQRAGAPPARGMLRAMAPALPLLGGLAALYALALVGAIPSPPFPFDPGLHEADAGAAITLSVVLAVTLAGALIIGARRATAGRAPAAAQPAAGAITALACVLIWIANPYLALLLAPTAHVWVLGAARRSPANRALTAVAALLACIPIVAAAIAVAAELDLGLAAPWTFALMVADGQIGFATCVCLCVLAGALGATTLLASRPDPSDDR